MIIDGKKIAAEVREQVRQEVALLEAPLVLGFVRSGSDMVAQQYVAMKTRTAQKIGIEVIEIPLADETQTSDAVAAVAGLVPRVHGIIVQLPLARHIDTTAVLASVPSEKDVDCTNGKDDHTILPPVIASIKEVLEREQVKVTGKRAVVVGSGRLVGAPAAAWLRSEGADIVVCGRDTANLTPYTKDAEIIVLGAGKANILTPTMIKQGVVILDAGTTESEGEVRGDADPGCAQLASVFTPVPGGIGPISVAMIFKNLLALAKENASD